MNEKKQIFLAPEPEIMTIITVMVVLAAAIFIIFWAVRFYKRKKMGFLDDMEASLMRCNANVILIRWESKRCRKHMPAGTTTTAW